jgi:pimeloyl-ACP methyl ester carboxylesterase
LTKMPDGRILFSATLVAVHVKAIREGTEIMQRLRTYGKPPYDVAVVHGGPGAGGEMAPVARELAPGWGVLEPIQTATTLEGQVRELRKVLETDGSPPITLVGHSWGAWLSFIVAARHPALVRKLILVGSGPFEQKYVATLERTRMERLSEAERVALQTAINVLGGAAGEDRDRALKRLRDLTLKTDFYDPLVGEGVEADAFGLNAELYQGVWHEAAKMRRSGRLLRLADGVRCPVVAIHGDYDPHPAEGVRVPLSARIERFRFLLLRSCGHTPWRERQARDRFFDVLERELACSTSAVL